MLKPWPKGVSGNPGGAIFGRNWPRAAPGAAEALTPIAKKYGIKALEGAGIGAGWQLYHELKKVFEGQ